MPPTGRSDAERHGQDPSGGVQLNAKQPRTGPIEQAVPLWRFHAGTACGDAHRDLIASGAGRHERGGSTERIDLPEHRGSRSADFSVQPAESRGTARPAVLLVQGGAWSRGSPEQLYRSARHFSEAGFVAAVLEYRLADATHSPVDSFSDVCHALAYMRTNADRLGLAPSRIALWGISSSGQLTAAATVGCDAAGGISGHGGPDALLLVSPVVDAASDGLFRDLMRGHGKPAAFSPTHTLVKRIVPTLIVQGNADRTTPIERSQVFCDKARELGSKCELVGLEGQAHVLDRAARAEVLARQVAFLRDLWH
jgi:acetyl esterase